MHQSANRGRIDVLSKQLVVGIRRRIKISTMGIITVRLHPLVRLAKVRLCPDAQQAKIVGRVHWTGPVPQNMPPVMSEEQIHRASAPPIF